MNKKYIVIIVLAILLVLALTIYFITNSKNVWTSDQNITDFSLVFSENKNIGKKKIVSRSIFFEDSYNVYLYNGELKIIINNTEYNLYEALKSDKLTMQDIVSKIKNEAKKSNEWDDGGSALYDMESFKVLKYKTISGNKDLYIGSNELNYNIGEKIQ